MTFAHPPTDDAVALRGDVDGSYLVDRAAEKAIGGIPTVDHVAPDLVWARGGDHVQIERFLRDVFGGPSRDEFQAALDDPFYEPTDRLLVKRGGRIAAHLHLVKRTMHFLGHRTPLSRVTYLATLPEYRGRGYASQLMAASAVQMREDHALLAAVATNMPEFFRRHGWTACGGASSSRASARDILSQLTGDRAARTPAAMAAALRPSRALNIRLWKHFELDALMRIYRQNTADSLGPLDRSEAYWQWLIARRAYDQIYVAIDGPDRLEIGEGTSPIVGYAVTKGPRIVELMTAPAHPTAAVRLLARVCADAIERDIDEIELEAPASHPLHEQIVAAGGTLQRLPNQRDAVATVGARSPRRGPFHRHAVEPHRAARQIQMVKIVDLPGLIGAIGPDLLRRIKRAGIPRPCESGLVVDGQSFVFAFSRRSMKLVAGKGPRAKLRVSADDLTRLLLGQDDVAELLLDGRVEATTASAAAIAKVLFPRVEMWWPPFDELPA